MSVSNARARCYDRHLALSWFTDGCNAADKTTGDGSTGAIAASNADRSERDGGGGVRGAFGAIAPDRKSTRLNSSHPV